MKSLLVQQPDETILRCPGKVLRTFHNLRANSRSYKTPVVTLLRFFSSYSSAKHSRRPVTCIKWLHYCAFGCCSSRQTTVPRKLRRKEEGEMIAAGADGTSAFFLYRYLSSSRRERSCNNIVFSKHSKNCLLLLLSLIFRLAAAAMQL